jgi:glycosyltransferase involved in cell wall biosynthesis
MNPHDRAAPVAPVGPATPASSPAGIIHERTRRYRSLSIVIPCYNERSTRAVIVERVLASPVALQKEIVLVDDGSTDGSADLIRSLAETHRSPRASFVTIFHERNRGKGAALRSGFAAATGDIIIVQDADLEYDPGDYPALVKPIVDGVSKVV